MKSLQIFSAALILLSFSACKKDKTISTPALPVSLVKTMATSTNGAAATISTYEYNADKKIQKINYDDGAYCNFIYAGQTVVADCYDKHAVATVKFTYTLNAAGLVSTSTTNLSPNTISSIDYNAAGQRSYQVTKVNGVVSSEYFYKYNNEGNKITDSLISANGTAINQYEYYTDKISTTEQKNLGQPYWGAGNKNCVKNITLISTGGLKTFSPYGVPVLDAAGRIAQASLTYNGNTSVYNYTYH